MPSEKEEVLTVESPLEIQIIADGIVLEPNVTSAVQLLPQASRAAQAKAPDRQGRKQRNSRKRRR